MKWSLADDQRLRVLYAGASMTAVQIAEQMGRSKASIKNRINKLGIKKPAGYVNTGRFTKGQDSWNKGRPFNSGGRSVETQFKPGHKPHTWHPVGHERVTKEGYMQRKMRDTGVTRHDYECLHHMLWKEHHGDIADGCAIVFRNGDKTDIRIENLECITRAELMRRNSYHSNYPPEVRHLVQLRGAITRQINKRTRSRNDHK